MKEMIETSLRAILREQGLFGTDHDIEINFSNTYITLVNLEPSYAIVAIEAVKSSLVELGLEVALSRNTEGGSPCFQLILQATPQDILKHLNVVDHFAEANQTLAKGGLPICFSYAPYEPPAQVPTKAPNSSDEVLGPDFNVGGSARKFKSVL